MIGGSAYGVPTAGSIVTVKTYLGGKSGRHFTSPGVRLLRVRLVGAGGGGAGGGLISDGASAGGDSSGTTIFGNSFTGGGDGGFCDAGNYAGGNPGGVGVNSPSIQILAFNGSPGSDGGAHVDDTSAITGLTGFLPGPAGAASFLGAGGSPGWKRTGQTPPANTGSGGAGGGALITDSGSTSTGGAGGSGAYLEMLITNPAPFYNFIVGTGGAGGTGASGKGFNGGPGSDGLIVVEEYG